MGRARRSTTGRKRLGENFMAAIGWDPETGKPSREALESMGGMADVARDLYG